MKLNTKKLFSTVAFAALSTLGTAAYAGVGVLNGSLLTGDGSEANPYDMGSPFTAPPLIDTLSVTVSGDSGSFFEEYVNFTAPAGTDGAAGAAVLEFGGSGSGIDNLFVEVWDDVHPGGVTLIASFAGDGLFHSFSLAAGGQYHLDVSGFIAANRTQGQYAVAMAIPEPETYAMLIAGLGLMGFVARRRQQKGLAAA